MLAESRLNVYILGNNLTARQRQRIQAQLQTALRAIPAWLLTPLQARLDSLGLRNFPLIVEPQDGLNARVLSLGMIEGRPAVRLLPRFVGDALDWGQDVKYLVTKALVYLASPEKSEGSFWDGWLEVVRADGLREAAMLADVAWQEESNEGLLLEMAAAYIVNANSENWRAMPHVKAFFDRWRENAGP